MMMDKKPLTDFEQKCYDLFTEGLTAHQICQRLKIRSDFVSDARYSILAKGYELPKLEVPSTELPRCADEIVYLERKPKEDKKMDKRKYKPLSEEERQQIVEEIEGGMTQKECGAKHGISQSRVSGIVAAHKKSLADQAIPELNPQTASQNVPQIVIKLVETKLSELDDEIASARDDLGILMQERDELVTWLGGAYDANSSS